MDVPDLNPTLPAAHVETTVRREALHSDVTLTVSLQQVLASIQSSVDSGFASVSKALEQKADKADVAEVRACLSALTGRVDRTEAWMVERQAREQHYAERDDKARARKERAVKAAGAVLSLFAAWGLVLVTILSVHHW